MTKSGCHPEQSEGSRSWLEVFRFAQLDKRVLCKLLHFANPNQSEEASPKA
jgi:hypothetical protein